MLVGFHSPLLEADKDGGGGAPDPDPTPAGGGNTSGSDAKFTQADVERLITERLNREGIKSLKQKAAKYDELETAKQTEAEKIAARAKELADKEQALTAREQRSELQDAITRFVAAEKITLLAPVSTVLRLLDTDAVDWQDGKPSNVGTLVKQLVKEHKYLTAARSGSGDGGDGNREPVKKNGMNDLIRGAWSGE